MQHVALTRQPTYTPSHSEIEESAVEAVGRLPHISDVLVQKENRRVITRHKVFQPQRTGAFSNMEDGWKLLVLYPLCAMSLEGGSVMRIQ